MTETNDSTITPEDRPEHASEEPVTAAEAADVKANTPLPTHVDAAAPSPEPPRETSSEQGEASSEPASPAADASVEASSGEAPEDPGEPEAGPDAFATTVEAPIASAADDGDDDGDDGDEKGDEKGDETAGDNVGNRVPAALRDDIGNRPGMGGEGGPRGARPPRIAGDDAAGKKRRRRRNKRKGEGGPDAPALEGSAVEAEGGEAAGESTEGEGGEAEAPRPERRKRPGPPRERPAFSVGEEVFGKVSKVTEHAVWIDIAGKAMGLFDRRALIENDAPADGDQFIATVASTGVRGGMLLLAREPLDFEDAKKRAEAAVESGDVIEGFVTGAIKGGLEVDIGGLRAFAPASHVDLRHGADLSYLVGQRFEFHVAQYAKKGRDIVVSRRKMLEGEARKARTEALSHLAPDSVHKGIVRKVVAWGVFVALPDAGGVEGLVHMTEVSHDRTGKLEDTFKVGEEIEVKVLRVDDKGKLWLSRKAAIADPWDAVKEKYAVGSRHKGTIARLQPFGAFIELEPGIDGLCHTADLSLKPIQHPSDIVKVGDEIEVVVANCDSQHRRIALHPAPPPEEADEPRQKVAPHKMVKAVVAQIVEGGLIVRVLGVTGRSARAFIPAGHTGTQRGTDLRKEFPVGTRLEAKVIDVDPRRGEAKLSIRALKEDAEKQAYQQYRAGVARDSKFGTFADLMKKS